MKKEINAISKLKIQRPDHIPFRYMTEEEKAKSAALSKNSYFKEKYRLALKISTQMEIDKYSQTNPEWGVKDVLVTILKGYNSDLPSVLVLEMTQLIVAEWEAAHAKKKEIVFI